MRAPCELAEAIEFTTADVERAPKPVETLRIQNPVLIDHSPQLRRNEAKREQNGKRITGCAVHSLVRISLLLLEILAQWAAPENTSTGGWWRCMQRCSNQSLRKAISIYREKYSDFRFFEAGPGVGGGQKKPI
jgi:hypothetical protein